MEVISKERIDLGRPEVPCMTASDPAAIGNVKLT
jgi:hypothetical protein